MRIEPQRQLRLRTPRIVHPAKLLVTSSPASLSLPAFTPSPSARSPATASATPPPTRPTPPPPPGVGVTREHHAALLRPDVALRPRRRRLLVERPDRINRLVEDRNRHAVVDHVEESPSLGGVSDLVNEIPPVFGRIDEREIDHRDSDFRRIGFESGESFGRVDEEFWDLGDAGIREAFDARFGVVEIGSIPSCDCNRPVQLLLTFLSRQSVCCGLALSYPIQL
ncbi:2-oxoglutarate (2OG) and Fe(II)-dependent oxygenase superfamily protein [Actinidia rufa]|uniref:2-oxoglutarate (2OG) and Fe(II)-dependent oxygenase superfamily protein n=1 Tax=Actinidia rufa TaxID=165716 RepID=A0A7J0FI34_9ERIC|nr:2-oxoglutarate (2OG) and Fe(II)-dependent oxygenase superfamily protein [Actinidia rufa]